MLAKSLGANQIAVASLESKRKTLANPQGLFLLIDIGQLRLFLLLAPFVVGAVRGVVFDVFFPSFT